MGLSTNLCAEKSSLPSSFPTHRRSCSSASARGQLRMHSAVDRLVLLDWRLIDCDLNHNTLGGASASQSSLLFRRHSDVPVGVRTSWFLLMFSEFG